MSVFETSDDRALAELAAFADGHLRGARREALAARVAAEPQVAALIAEQRRAAGLVRAAMAATVAPLALRERLERVARGEH